MLLLLGLIWGGSFFFARIAVQTVPPLTLVLYRVALAAFALHLYLAARQQYLWQWRSLAGAFLVQGLLNNAIPFSLLFAGQTVLGAGLASILNATTPIWTIVIAAFLTTDERASPARIVGVLLGILGTIVMIGPAAISGLGAPVWAYLAIIGAALSYALAAIYAKRFKGVPPTITATGQLTGSTLIMIPLVLITEGIPDIAAPGMTIWACIAALSLVSTAFAYILFFSIVKMAGATNTSLVTLIVPVSAILLGALFLGERLTPFDYGGIALIASGLLAIDGRAFRRFTRRV
ncbi:MAG: DMT family transporter [Phyllobacterium sp.]